jgi:hypothetical protein
MKTVILDRQATDKAFSEFLNNKFIENFSNPV